MKRQLTSILLFSALLVGGASTFVSCTDHESDSAYDTSVSLADAIAKQKSDLTKLNDWLGELKEKNPTLADAIDARIKANKQAIEDLMAENFVTYGKLDAAIQETEAYNGLKNEIAAIEKLRVNDSTAFAKMDSTLQAKIDTLGTKVNSIEEMQDKMKTALDYLVNKNLSNIAINATENPVTGYWNAAFLGSQLNLISSFYGVPKADGNEGWGIKGNKVIGENGNAGYIYVSLNPTELDPSLVQVELVNSQGEPAKGFKLGAIEKTDKVLTYGYTRATSKNGFYQIPVIASDPQNDDFALDKGSLKEAAKTVLGELKDPKGNDFDLTKVAAALYKNNLNNKLTAYTVKATYYLYDAELGEYVKKTQVAPTYNLAAFAVKPLSFNFGKDNQYLDKLSGWSMEHLLVPSLSEKLKSFANGIKVDVTYEGNKKINVYTILAAPGVKASEIKADGSVDLCKENGELIQNIPNVSEVTTKEVDTDVNHTTLKTKVIVLKSTDDSISKVLESVNNSIAKQLDPIKNNIINAGEKWDNMASKVNTVLKKVYSKIGSANRLLEPTILYLDNNNNPNTLSTLGGRLGTRFVGLGSTTLYATSWTAELLAPAYLKSVYVVEDGAEITLADGKTSAKTPFNGTRLIFTAKNTGKYTIVYKAVDYSGFEVEKTFHVEVVK
ncbi:MAG: hypothetical protein U0K41_04630 [Segatella copri]|nr:hypothetical protein [Segatella copri]